MDPEIIDMDYTQIMLRVIKATVLLTNGTDKICLTLNTPTPFPEMGYPATATIDTRCGYGEEWCKTVLGIEPEVINTKFHIENETTINIQSRRF